MKNRLDKVLQAVFAGFLILCVFGGLVLMMCESDDWNTQRLTLLGGLALFLIGTLPGILISIRYGGKHGYY